MRIVIYTAHTHAQLHHHLLWELFFFVVVMLLLSVLLLSAGDFEPARTLLR